MLLPDHNLLFKLNIAAMTWAAPVFFGRHNDSFALYLLLLLFIFASECSVICIGHCSFHAMCMLHVNEKLTVVSAGGNCSCNASLYSR
jgi:hypothetical protein